MHRRRRLLAAAWILALATRLAPAQTAPPAPADLATYRVALPDQYDPHAAYSRADKAIDGAWDLTRADLQRTLPTILNPVQLQLLPALVRNIYTSTGPLHIRVFIAGG